MGICAKCGHDNLDQAARFCAACGVELKPTERRNLRKTVTVIFSDVKGSVGLGEQLDPEALTDLMNRYFEEMRMVIERHGGIVEKYIGDAVKAVFGIPRVHEDDALRAVRAAAEMRTALKTLNKEIERDYGTTLEVRTGLNSGSVLAEEATDLRTLPLGDAINIAARLEQVAGLGEILIGADTYRMVRDAVEAEPVELELKGKSAPLTAYRLLQVAERAPGIRRRLEMPLIGRERELTLMRQMFEHTVDERVCHLFTLLGTAGVGKSRLCLEFEQSLEQVTVLHGRCLSYGEGITFWPMIEVLQEAAEVSDQDSPEAARRKIAELVQGDERSDVIADKLSQVAGLSGEAAGVEEIFFSVRKLFELLGKEKPLVVVFDDIHWAEPTFLDLLEDVASWARGGAIFLVCLARPELLDSRAGWAGGQVNATSIRLEPLQEERADQMLANLLEGGDLDPNVRARLKEVSAGHPLFLEEMVAMLVDNGWLLRDNGRWELTTEIEQLKVPTTIEALLTARLENLSDEERRVIERAAIGGQVFSQAAVERLSDADLRPQVKTHLRSLLGKDLVQPEEESFSGDETFRFRHILIRDAAYEAIPKKHRAALHQRYGAWLEGAAPARGTEYEEIVAYHYERAALLQREMRASSSEIEAHAGGRLAAAGRKALGRLDARAAVNLLERALALHDRSTTAGIELLIDLGSALLFSGEMLRASEVLSEALAATATIPHQSLNVRKLAARASVHQAMVRLLTEPDIGASDIEAVTEDARPVLEKVGDSSGLAVLWHLVGIATEYSGNNSEALKAFQRSLEYAISAQDKYWEDSTRTRLLFALFYGPSPYDEVLHAIDDHLEWARSNGLERQQVAAFAMRAGALGFQGNFDAAGRTMAEYRSLGGDVSHRGSHVTRWAAADLARASGNLLEAERIYVESYEILDKRGEEALVSSLVAWIADVLCDQGRYEDAYPWTERGERSAGLEDAHAQSFWRLTRARVLANRGDFVAAEKLARSGMDIIRKSGFIVFQPEALRAFAEVLERAGKIPEAVAALEEAMELDKAKGNVVMARREQEKLQALRR